MSTIKGSGSNFRSQRKGQNARQAMVISSLNTIYRNNTDTHFIKSHQRTEPRIYLLDITVQDMNKFYPKINQIIERGRLRPKGTETFFVSKKMEHLLITESAIYEIRANATTQHQNLHERIPVDGSVTTMEVIHRENSNISVLVDESYYELQEQCDTRHITPTNHIVTRQIKKVVKTHPKSMNAFVFIFNESETEVVDFYMTTENGIVMGCGGGGNVNASSDRLTRTCKDDLISFIEHFKLCS
jgi:DNA-binding Lrp family transcriptional regulator